MSAAKSLQSCTTLCDPIDHSPPGFSVHGILQARILKWVTCSSPGDLPDPGIEPAFLTSPELAGGFFTTSATWRMFNIPDALDKAHSLAWLMRPHLFPRITSPGAPENPPYFNPRSPGGSSGSASLQRQRESSEEAEVSLSMKRELPGILSRCQWGNAGAWGEQIRKGQHYSQEQESQSGRLSLVCEAPHLQLLKAPPVYPLRWIQLREFHHWIKIFIYSAVNAVIWGPLLKQRIWRRRLKKRRGNLFYFDAYKLFNFEIHRGENKNGRLIQ